MLSSPVHRDTWMPKINIQLITDFFMGSPLMREEFKFAIEVPHAVYAVSEIKFAAYRSRSCREKA